MARSVRIDRAEPLLQKAPVNRPRQLRQRMIGIDDLVEPRLEEIVLPTIAPVSWPHRITLHRADGGRESRPKPPFKLHEIKLIELTFLQKRILAKPRNRPQNMEVQNTSRTTKKLYGQIPAALQPGLQPHRDGDFQAEKRPTKIGRTHRRRPHRRPGGLRQSLQAHRMQALLPGLRI